MKNKVKKIQEESGKMTDIGGNLPHVQVIVDDVEFMNNSFALYHIHVKLVNGDNIIWETKLKKRFSDFVKLRSDLLEEVNSNELPYELPERQFGIWSRQLSMSKGVIRDRKVKLGKFLYDLLNDSFDTRWKYSNTVRKFLLLACDWKSLLEKSGAVLSGSDKNITTSRPTGWLEAFRECKTKFEECKGLYSTDRTKAIMKLRLLVNQIEKNLNEMEISTEELERRHNLLKTLKQDINKLSLETSIPALSSLNEHDLIHDALSKDTGSNNLGLRPTVGRRRIGETSETLKLDNQQMLQLHKTTMQDQDQELESLRKMIQRQKNISIEMNEELAQQNELMDSVDHQINTASSKLNRATRQAKRFNDS